MRKIAVIGLNTLEYVAVRSILESTPHTSIELLAYGGECQELPERYDKFIVSADVFAKHTDFFLPRKNKTLIICKGEKVSDNNLITVGDNGDLIDVISAFERFCKVENEEEMTTELSAREIEVLKELVNGLTIKEIADKLCISANTASSHRKNISAKLGIRSVSGLSVYAIMNGLV